MRRPMGSMESHNVILWGAVSARMHKRGVCSGHGNAGLTTLIVQPLCWTDGSKIGSNTCTPRASLHVVVAFCEGNA